MGHTGAGIVSVNANPPHPNAALLFTNWLLSKEGQAIITREILNPSMRLDVSTAGIPKEKFPEPGEKVVTRDEEMYELTSKMTSVWKEIIDAYMQGAR